MKKRTKIISIALLSLLVVGLVSAGIVQYFGNKQTTIEASLPILVSGTEPETLDPAYGCTQVSGEVMTIENLIDQEINIEISSECKEDGEDCEVGAVNTSYVGTLELTQKNTVTWEPKGDTIEINYTVVGETFETSGIPVGYTLIYYKDKGTYTTDEERLLVLGKSAVLSENMPHADDWNAGEFANYCDKANGYDDYNQCKGAKLWVVPNDNIISGLLTWSNPDEYYFETDLIQYNKEGIITMYPNSILVINPVFDLDCMLEGTVVINTTIDNI